MWNHVESATLDGDAWDLYERGGVYMIRVNGWELMNGECHESEAALGRLAGLMARDPDPDILLGGLGLGYTLASLTRALEGTGRITVAELSDAVLRWFRQHTGRRLFPQMPSNVRLMQQSVMACLGQARWDVVVLDVDNGPEALSSRENAALYSEAGLAAWRDSLKADGVLLVWSSFEDPAFVERGRLAGFSGAVLPVLIARRPGPFHYIYALSKTPFAERELKRFGLAALSPQAS